MQNVREIQITERPYGRSTFSIFVYDKNAMAFSYVVHGFKTRDTAEAFALDHSDFLINAEVWS